MAIVDGRNSQRINVFKNFLVCIINTPYIFIIEITILLRYIILIMSSWSPSRKQQQASRNQQWNNNKFNINNSVNNDSNAIEKKELQQIVLSLTEGYL